MSSPDRTHTLEIDSVELSFGERQILTNVYLKLETGKVTALLGRNGSGKSCLMRILFNELTPTYKSTRIDSVWCEKLSNAQVLYLPQSCCIPSYVTVEAVLNDFGLSFDDFADLFPSFNYFIKKRIGELSGGERRIVEIYALLKAESQFVMLDEPFSQIMPIHVSTIKSLIVQEKKRKGILLTDHVYTNVVDIADTLYVISNQSLYLTESEGDLVKYGYVNHLF